ncbi:ubiquitin elongating factor core-domain-containing protein [Boletus edulis BED1]|uniref:RING-type E3 ubiquitin transferase n=1 Tax=Boletus edulis BED1 TaxID=1328754 RepID=A0AAD4BXF5_BOLED|nr:ubiquitin elongating factor core-domain-containing protein [Boletus edulis BED1]
MTDPQDDADRIRAKRLAKLQAGRSNAPSPDPASPSVPAPKPAQPKRAQTLPAPQQQAPIPSVPLKRKSLPPMKLDIQSWEDETLTQIFKVTLKSSVAERSNFDIVWLKGLEAELASEGYSSTMNLTGDIADRLLISRLELDPQAMSDDLGYLSVLASLPSQMTVYEYLVGCWKRINSAKSNLAKKNPVNEMQQASALLENIRNLVISYAGFTLQDPEMFPQPAGRELGPSEFVASLLSLSALSTPLTTASSPNYVLSPTEVEPFLQDLARRFEPDNEIDGVLGPVLRQLLFHSSLFRPEGLAGGDSSWRGVVGGMEALVSVKSIAVMFTRLDEWNPPHATASTFETVTLMGPLCRLGVFSREWPNIAQSYFSEPNQRPRNDVESSTVSLRGTVKSLQSSLFHIFNTLLNIKRAGMQVDPQTVASDSFMVNLQSILLSFAEPFIDSRYSKMDRIDPLYFAVSNRIDVSEETRIKATSEEAGQWAEANRGNAATPNFISEIFYLCNAMGHYGYLRTTQTYDDFAKHHDELQRHHDMINSDGSWIGSPTHARTEAALNQMKTEMGKIQTQQLAFRVQLLEPDFVLRYMGFTNFVSTWLIRRAGPKGLHPTPPVELPLPQEVPMSFRVLPEYILEDVVEFFLFVTRHSPDSLDLSGKDELVVFALTFMTSTWYIKNPFLKAKINEAVFYGVLPYGNSQNGILGGVLNSHPLALKHLVPALTHFYIEVEQTGASSQFYDKFSKFCVYWRNIAHILKAIWGNPAHRQALNTEALNVEKFVRFVNLMINDVTYLMDESLSELTQIHNIQTEMRDQTVWAARPAQYRRERENTLRGLERHASSYTTLGKSTVGLLREFTAETKAPFMMPEIVDKLAAMLDYNLEALVGPKCGELRVKEPEKYHFDPRKLLSDILQVYLNLSDQDAFARAVANDGRSYKKELFERAIERSRRITLKPESDLEQMRLFVVKVEEAKALIEVEDDLGEIPDEFLDPLMFTLMRDPVVLPSSRTVLDRATIKSHLLSDAKDPFNRVPLKISEVIPDPELKARIDAFVAERRSQRARHDSDVVMLD